MDRGNSMTTAHKPTYAKIPRERLDIVRERYLRGHTTLRIQTELSKLFGCTCRTIRSYLRIVRKQLAKAEESNTEAVRLRAEFMLLESYEMARDRKGFTKDGDEFGDPDVKSMVAAAHRLAELFGAMGAKRIEHTGKDGVPLNPGVIYVPAVKHDE